MSTYKQQKDLDKATQAMLTLGSLPKGYEAPKASRKDKDQRFRLYVQKGKCKVVEMWS